MKPNTHKLATRDLPEIIPIFPLEGALLLPGGRLPLNIFEGRNLDMVADAIATPARLIGMIQQKEAHLCANDGTEAEGGQNLQQLYPIGCLGRISSFTETGDGRNLIALDGIIRFRILAEVASNTRYRKCRVGYDEFAADLEKTDVVRFDRLQLISLMKRYFKDKGFAADWDTVNRCGDEKLVNTLAMICPLGAQQKQVLLEAKDAGVRGDMLSQLLQLEDGHIISHDQH